jgi:hypothetical protein
MSNLRILVTVKMLDRLERELKKLNDEHLEFPNEERKCDIDLHRKLIIYIRDHCLC